MQTQASRGKTLENGNGSIFLVRKNRTIPYPIITIELISFLVYGK